MGKQKVKLFFLIFLFVPISVYAIETGLRDKVIEQTLYALETAAPNEDYPPEEQAAIEQETEKSLLGNLKGFTQSFKANDGFLDFGLRFGYIDGNTAYDFDHHTSELQFPFRNLMGGGNISLGYKDFSFNSEIWGSLNSDAGWHMKDKDWDGDGVLISDTLSKAKMNAVILDGNLRYNFYKYAVPEEISQLVLSKSDAIKIGALVGYRYQRFGFNLYGLNYPDYDLTFYDGQKIGTYRIKYYLPYFGLAADVANDKFGISMSAKYAFSPHVRDEDNHLLRQLTFFGDYKKKGNVFMANLSGFWRFYKGWTLSLGADVSLIRLDGTTWEADHDPAWDLDQSTDTKQVIYWSGLGYRF